MESLPLEAHSASAPQALDHVALRVADRDGMAAFLSEGLGIRVLERTEQLTVVGADAHQGKLFLLAADGPREPGVLARVVFRVADLDRALASLPRGIDVHRPLPETALFHGPEGLVLGLTQVLGGVEYDLDHVVLDVAAPEDVTLALAELGLVPRGGALHVGDRQVRLEQRPVPPGERPLLDHLGLLVESVDAVAAQARQRGLEIDRAAEAIEKLAIFVPGPERIRIEYLEHVGASALS
jgi:catechol 2,3-dioxygenase-like lactoylglutathione lyase family enzyme